MKEKAERLRELINRLGSRYRMQQSGDYQEAKKLTEEITDCFLHNQSEEAPPQETP